MFPQVRIAVLHANDQAGIGRLWAELLKGQDFSSCSRFQFFLAKQRSPQAVAYLASSPATRPVAQ